MVDQRGRAKKNITLLEEQIGAYLLLNPNQIEGLWDLLEEYTPRTPEFAALLTALRASKERYGTYAFRDEFLLPEIHVFWLETLNKYRTYQGDLEFLPIVRGFLEKEVFLHRMKERLRTIQTILDVGVTDATVLLDAINDLYACIRTQEREVTLQDVPQMLHKLVRGELKPSVHPFLHLREVFGYPILIFGGDLTVLAGRTGRGKTTCALNLALSYLRAGKNVCYISTEMGETALAFRLAAIIAKVPWDKLWGEEVDVMVAERVRESVRELLHSPSVGKLFIYHAPYCTPSHVTYAIGKAISHFEGEGVDAFIVDYIQQMSMVGRGIENRAHELGAIARYLADIGAQYNCAAIVVSQVNDAGEIKDSRAIAERAALVVKLGMLSPQQFVDHILQIAGLDSQKKKAGMDRLRRWIASLRRYYLDVSVEKNRYGYCEPAKVVLLDWDASTGKIGEKVDIEVLRQVVRAAWDRIQRGEEVGDVFTLLPPTTESLDAEEEKEEDYDTEAPTSLV